MRWFVRAYANICWNNQKTPIIRIFLSILLLSFYVLRVTGQGTPVILPEPPAPVIYLDFTGHYVTATSWNWNGPIDAKPFTGNEMLMQEIQNRIGEDFSIFNVNITRDSNVYEGTPPFRRVRVIITPTYQWYGQAGGVAFVGSFNWGDETPVFVFSSLLQNNPKFIAEAASHEIGHALGLNHQSRYRADCSMIEEYASGVGTGETGWAPIMGIGYYHNVTTWHYGPSSLGCREMQDDIAVIQRNSSIYLKADDHGNDTASATLLNTSATEFGKSGIINTPDDKDIFRIDLPTTTRISINVIPFYAGEFNSGANVHLSLSLIQSPDKQKFSRSEINRLNTEIDTVLPAGQHYIEVEGLANDYMKKSNGLGTYTLTGVMAHALPVTAISLQGNMVNNMHQLSWNYAADEPISSIELQYSTDGLKFKPLAILRPEVRSYAWKPANYPAVYYRLKVITANNDNTAYSRILLLKADFNDAILIQPEPRLQQVMITVSSPGRWMLYRTNGSLLRSGSLAGGRNIVSLSGNKREMLILKVYSSQNQRVYKLQP